MTAKELLETWNEEMGPYSEVFSNEYRLVEIETYIKRIITLLAEQEEEEGVADIMAWDKEKSTRKCSEHDEYLVYNERWSYGVGHHMEYVCESCIAN